MEVSFKYFYAATGWVLWCAFHSALISITVTEYMKRKLGSGFRFYRIIYNTVSVLTLIPLLYYSRLIREAPVFYWKGPWVIVQILLATVAIWLLVAGARHYSWAQFSGIAQIRAGRVDGSLCDCDSFVVSGVHRIIRHPWYLGGMMIIWVGNQSVSTILINIIISVYFVVGSFLEDRKLVRQFGDQYREYRQSVSMLFPWRWLKAKI
jgi:protein-S-isoprenylcysteine O-methyltransferase Ste14